MLSLTLFLLTVHSYGQEKLHHNQIGINMGEFVPLFRTQSTNFDLNYYLHFDTLYAMRAGLNYSKVTGDDGRLNLGYKIGFQRRIKKVSLFSIYSGLDFNHTYLHYDNDDRSNSSIGTSLFLGIRYNPKPYLSISTEPGFYWFNVISRDPNGFQKTRDSWNEFSIDNIGQLLISLHF